MKFRLLKILLIAGLVSSTSAKANYFAGYEPTPEEARVINLKAFYICKIKEGMPKELITKDLKRVFKNQELNYNLMNKKELIDIY